MTTTTHILGYPRIGEKRELKFAQEKYWRGEIDQAELKKSRCEVAPQKLANSSLGRA